MSSRSSQDLDLDDLDAGARPGGYVEPSEAAWEVVGKALKPYLDDLERRITLRHEDEAFEVCRGSSSGYIVRSVARQAEAAPPKVQATNVAASDDFLLDADRRF
jgi:hypothetical protein